MLEPLAKTSGSTLPKNQERMLPLGLRERDVFARLLPGASIREIAYEELPEAASAFFEACSRKLILPEACQARAFLGLFEISHPNGDRAYLAHQKKNLGPADHDAFTYLVEFRAGRRLGHGELSYPQKGPVPFQSFTGTEEEFQGQGLSRRRLFTWNAYCGAFYNLPLYSGITFVAQSDGGQYAKAAWQRLCEEGVAEAIRLPSVAADGAVSERIRFKFKNAS